MKPRVLVLCDDQWHPPENIRRGLGAIKNLGVDFEFLDNGSQWSPGMLKDFPLVVVAKANHICATNQNPWLTAETQWSFRDFVRAGGGLLLLHSGTCYKDLPAMRGVTGGAFLSHPAQCLVVVQPVSGHPVSVDVEVFIEEDEHYQMAQDDPQAEVFLLAQSDHGIQPAGWTRTEGTGRVCALTPGHNLDVWLNKEFQKLLANAVRWTARLN